MSIFNTSGAGGSGAGDDNVAVWTYTGSGTNPITSISFSVKAQPTQWALVCAGPLSGYTPARSSSYYVVCGAYWFGSSIYVSAVRYYNGTARIYGSASSISQSYSNGTLTLTGSSSRVFEITNSDSSSPVTYYLIYSTE